MPALTLHWYQEKLLEDIKAAIRAGHRRILVVLPTGGGKTVVAATMLGGAAAKGNRSIFNVHRRELVKQASRTFDFTGIGHGIIAADFAACPSQLVRVAGIQTLARRLHSTASPQLMVWDECHHLAAATWSAIFAAYPDIVHIGLTATPERLDGRGLGEFFTIMIQGPTARELIEMGFLSPYRLFAPTLPDMGDVHTKMGEYVKAEAAAKMDRGSITGDAILHYRRLADRQRALAFCVSIKHSRNVVAQFNAAGIPAAHIDGVMDTDERDAAIAALERGRVRLLSNVGLVGEGFDLPSIVAVIDLAPTQSLANCLQRWGRGMRTCDGKDEAIIIDHAGNCLRHGLPDDAREWSLEGRPKGRRRKSEQEIEVHRCPTCYRTLSLRVARCSCGHVFVAGEGRKVETKAGELVEVDVVAARRQRKAEERAAKTLEDLVTLGIARGYRHPEGWARRMIEIRESYRRAAQ